MPLSNRAEHVCLHCEQTFVREHSGYYCTECLQTMW